MKKILFKTGLSLLAGAILFTGCTSQMADNYAFSRGNPKSQQMFMNLSKDKELATELSKYWETTFHNKDGIIVIEEKDLVQGFEEKYFSEKFYPAYENSHFVKEYVAFVAKRGNTVKKYNSNIHQDAIEIGLQQYYWDYIFQKNGTGFTSQFIPRTPIYIEFDKDGRIVSALGVYVWKYGELNVSVTAFHTYFTGETAKKLERIFTKKQLEDNLAF